MTEVMLKGRRKNVVRVNAMAVGTMIRDIQEGVYSMPELSERCGLSIQTVRLYMKHLHKAGAVYVADWAEDNKGGRTLRVYALGQEKDAPRPPVQTGKEACRKYREKKKMMKMLHTMVKGIT
jgi:predicted ArsR family transcriptional regulator